MAAPAPPLPRRLMVLGVWMAVVAMAEGGGGGEGAPPDAEAKFAIEETDSVPYEGMAGLLDTAFCADYIVKAEEEPWDTTNDSVDSLPQYTIDVYDHGRVTNQNLWELLEPRLDHITERLRARFPGQARILDWIFLRKYSADERPGLLAHKDVSTLSVILPLNIDYEGGELYFIRKNSTLHSEEHALAPQGPAMNTSTYFFPQLTPGSATLYDDSVYHGIRKVTSGTKYSLVLFYDMPEIDGVIHTEATFLNMGTETMMLWYIPEFDEPIVQIQDWHPKMKWEIGSFIGHIFEVHRHGGGRISSFRIEGDPARLYVYRDGSIKTLEIDSSEARESLRHAENIESEQHMPHVTPNHQHDDL